MTITDLLTNKLKKESGYTNFTWGKIKNNKIQAKDNKTDKIIAEYNFNNGKLTIK